jgi:hypothetical protein
MGGPTHLFAPASYRAFFAPDRLAADFDPPLAPDFDAAPFRAFDPLLPAVLAAPFVPLFEAPEFVARPRFEVAALEPPDFEARDFAAVFELAFEALLVEARDFAPPVFDELARPFAASPRAFFVAPCGALPLARFVPVVAPPRAALVFVAPRRPPLEAREAPRAPPRFEPDAARPVPERFAADPDERETNLKNRLVPPDPTSS